MQKKIKKIIVWFRDVENDDWVDGKTLLGH
jgi:hypothetical protein